MDGLRALIGCEASGEVRRAFLAFGWDAWSCDLRPAEDGSNRHLRMDVREAIHRHGPWDLLAVMHPPCTRLCNSGVRWLHVPPPNRTLDDMRKELEDGAALFSDCLNAPIDRIAVENPVMHKHAKALIRNYVPPAQSIQPWQFGDGEAKRTCFWLKGLPPLVPIVRERPDNVVQRVWRMPPGPDRQRERSRFFPGVAAAMAQQWGDHASIARPA
jgi:hypothetical protein